MVNEPKISESEEFRTLLGELRSLIRSARRAVARSVDTLQVLTNLEIGRRIVEHEQQGEKRAEYGKGLLQKLADSLTGEFGRGFSRTNLKLMRKFYLLYHARIGQTPSDLFLGMPKGQTVSDLSQASRIAQQIVQIPSAQCTSPFKLSWSHYVFLMAVKDPEERSFYEIEAAEQENGK